MLGGLLLAGMFLYLRPSSHGTDDVPPQRHEFKPGAFHQEFSPSIPPVLHVTSGDTIHTTTIDAAGTDENNVRRAPAGNPVTGPFYIRNAMPGDTIAVHLKRLRLNRDWAVSGNMISNRAITSALLAKMNYRGEIVRWRLDRTRGVATRDNPPEGLARYVVPIRPMLGCVALAPQVTGAAPDTGEVGPWGGNMDFNEIVEGTTVYLPVNVPGGLLYFGDAHAAQGDGELSSNGLETSLDVEIGVTLLRNRHTSTPHIESSTHIMVMGLGDSLDTALRNATSAMLEWLVRQYKLTPPEVAQVLGTSAEYRVSLVVGKSSGIVLKINRELLRGLSSAER
jgi:acetamidase/formamidase